MSDIPENTPVIDDDNWREFMDVTVDGETMGRGLEPRDYEQNPQGSYSAVRPFTIDTIPMDEWPERIRIKEETKSRLSDIRMVSGPSGERIPSLDQGNSNYCWAHSPVAAAMLARARDFGAKEYVRLSAFSVAVPIKNGRNQGGWSPEAFEYIGTKGCASVADWPEKSWQGSRGDAGQYKIAEGFMDLNPPVYNRNLSILQVGTSLLLNMPVNGDFNHWRHSVCLMDLLDLDTRRAATDPLRYGVLIWNSWRDSWGNLGTGILRGTKWIPDGACAVGDMLMT